MTIRLLCAHGIYPANAIVTLDAGTEAGLIAAKMAQADLTGGVVYVPPTPQVQSVPVTAEAATLVIVSNGVAVDADGRPNGTVYIQTAS